MSEEKISQEQIKITLDSDKVNQQLEGILLHDYLQASGLLNTELASMSNRGIKRVIFAALSHNVVESKFNFKNKAEAKCAAILSKVLDLRTQIQAVKLRLEELENKEQEKKEDVKEVD